MSDLKNIRFDTVKIPKVRKTDDGFLEGEVIAGRAGVFAYESASGSIIYELRHQLKNFKNASGYRRSSE
jgi:hypothetical protein